MRERVLIAASVASFMIQFNMSDIRILKEMGYDVEVAGNFKEGNSCSDEELKRLCDLLDDMKVAYHHIDFSRSGTAIGRHIKAYRQMKRLLSDRSYSFVHLHSPIGGAIGRLAAHFAGTPVVYTAHGFHFYDGAPLKNWLMFYPVERYLSRYTDILLVMNKEDHERAERSFHAKKTMLIPGVGVDLNRFSPTEDEEAKRKLRGSLGADDETMLLFSVGEMTLRKNHRVVIEALGRIKRQRGSLPKVIYAIAGKPEPEVDLIGIARENGVSENVRLLGYRSDISELNSAADAFVFPSKQEGLPLALMEAMAAKTPVIASRIRGNVDLITDDRYMYEPSDVAALTEILGELLEHDRTSWREHNTEYTDACYSHLKTFGLDNVDRIMEDIYRDMASLGALSADKEKKR